MQSGPNDLTEETVGVNYRALRDLFLLSQQRKDTVSYNISVQMLEIYNDQVRDLLATDGGNKKYPFLIQPFSLNCGSNNLYVEVIFKMIVLFLYCLSLITTYVRNSQQFSNRH